MDDTKPLPSWNVPDEDVKFPEGWYIFALGGVRAVYNKDDPDSIDAMVNDLWVVKYVGTDLNPVSDVRIMFKDNKLTMGAHGVRIVERYPNPAFMPKLAFRARAFFAKFDVFDEVKTGDRTQKMVSWQRVASKYGTIFKAMVFYNKGKNGKSYRNFDYEGLEVLDQRISADQMKAIEERYASLKAQEDNANTKVEAPPGVSDLPF